MMGTGTHIFLNHCLLGTVLWPEAERLIMLGLFYLSWEIRLEVLLEKIRFGAVGIQVLHLHPFKYVICKRYLLLQ